MPAATMKSCLRCAERLGQYHVAQEEKQRLERTLARAQRIIGSLHIERAELIQQIAGLTERHSGGDGS